MIFNYLDKLAGLLDRRFIIAYWAPVFIGAALFGAVVAAHAGLDGVLTAWDGLEPASRLVLAVAVLLGITMAGYVLQALTGPIVRFYEGYTLWRPLAKAGIAAQRRRLGELEKEEEEDEEEDDTARTRRYFLFPHDPDYLRPTRLGNVLTAAEQYPFHVYGLEGVLWWPRLFPLLPDGFREQVDAALMPMVSLLNLSVTCAAVALAGGAYVGLADHREWLLVAVFVGAMVLSWLFYHAAVSQAVGYGNLVRSAYDLYRHEILKRIGLFVPKTFDDEEKLWDVLNTWVYDQHVTPYMRAGADMPGWVRHPFRYDGTVPDEGEAAEPEPQRLQVRLGWLPKEE